MATRATGQSAKKPAAKKAPAKAAPAKAAARPAGKAPPEKKAAPAKKPAAKAAPEKKAPAKAAPAKAAEKKPAAKAPEKKAAAKAAPEKKPVAKAPEKKPAAKAAAPAKEKPATKAAEKAPAPAKAAEKKAPEKKAAEPKAEKSPAPAAKKAAAEPVAKAPAKAEQAAASEKPAEKKPAPKKPSKKATGDLENQLYLELPAGRVIIMLRPDLAPGHVTRIKELARQGYYDGLSFHRVIEGFMAQTGDPRGDGTGGSGQKLKAEFSEAPHERGTVSMARAANVDSADSQFFICFAPARFLDRQYTVWGQVTSGMEFVDQIKKGDRVQNGMVSDPDKIVSLKVAADVEE